jgi:hypothetical protein
MRVGPQAMPADGSPRPGGVFIPFIDVRAAPMKARARDLCQKMPPVRCPAGLALTLHD